MHASQHYNAFKDEELMSADVFPPLFMDLYALTMAQGYFLTTDYTKRVAFDLFYRKNPDQGGFTIFAGLPQVIKFLNQLKFSEEDLTYLKSLAIFKPEFLDYLVNFSFRGDIYTLNEGTISYPQEPLMTVIAPLIEAQLIETALINQINHQTLIATKARRLVKAAAGRSVIDFGARRAHNYDAAIYGARAAYIGGVTATATVTAGQRFNIPLSGTMAHSWIMLHPDELTAFRRFAELYPKNCLLLVDTYDVLNQGVPHAIEIFRELKAQGKKFINYGIRIDSGDLAYLTKSARKLLNDAGFFDAKIVVSNSLDEYTIKSILDQGGEVDAFGVGENLITARSEAILGAVYKLCAAEEHNSWEPRIKISETIEKITNPGLKDLYRVYDPTGHAVADLITLAGEKIDLTKPYRYINPEKPWENCTFNHCYAKNIRIHLVKQGKLTRELPSLEDVAGYVKLQLDKEIWPEEQRFTNPHRHYLAFSPNYYSQKLALLHEKQIDSREI